MCNEKQDHVWTLQDGLYSLYPQKRQQRVERAGIRAPKTEFTASGHVELLGVTLDGKMKLDLQIATVTARVTGRYLAVGRLRRVRSKQVRQLYNATVILIMDYCASAWYGPEKSGALSLLRNMEMVERIGAHAVVPASRNVVLKVAEAEAYLKITTARLRRKMSKNLLRCFTVPEIYSLLDSLTKLYTQEKRSPPPRCITAREFGHTIGFTADSLIETVEAVAHSVYRYQLEVGEDWHRSSTRRERKGDHLEGVHNQAVGDSTLPELNVIELVLAHQVWKIQLLRTKIVATDKKPSRR
ncbi:hypothetical protein D6D01_09738 [Aureobasidium pullulans]|uniref:Uncharacterized protein n=1 Tax=Aureobasidium pullulans TaxID=5580 RepID=A0A4S9JX93_AURPU|nr:hypothetical protein D6D01_09738 [Aureobasidium pullulans]